MKRSILPIVICSAFLVTTGCTDKNEKTAKNKESTSSEKIQEGVHYRVIEADLDDLTADVTKFFWFGCSHCNNFRGPFDQWVSENPEFTTENIHSTLSNQWMQDHVLFQIIQDKDYGKEAVDAVYDYIHEDKGESGDLITYLEKKGVPVQKSDFNIDEKQKEIYTENIAKVSGMERKIKAQGVPYVVVKGEYLMLNQGFDSYEDMMEGTKWLIENK